MQGTPFSLRFRLYEIPHGNFFASAPASFIMYRLVCANTIASPLGLSLDLAAALRSLGEREGVAAGRLTEWGRPLAPWWFEVYSFTALFLRPFNFVT